MELQKVLETRRSLRSYEKDRTIQRETVEQLIQAASLAPSWKNSQTARYHIIMSPEMVEQFRKECLPEFNAKSSDGAPVLIVTSFVANRSGYEKDGNPTNELGNGWGCYDLGLSNENLLLKAKELDLDTLIMGIRDVNQIRKMLEIPEEECIVSVISVGYGDIKPSMPPRKKVQDVARFY